jgi:tetratricopeptide (TPR) repeat protein
MTATRWGAGLFLLALAAAATAQADGELTAEQRQQLEKKARGLSDEANQLQEAGAYDKALPPRREALEIHQRLYPKDKYPDGHPDLAQSLHGLGDLLRERGEYARAEPLLREALDMRRRLYPKDKYPDGHADLARSLNHLGLLFRAVGDNDKAQACYREALAMRRRLYPKDKYPNGHADLAQSLHNLGALFFARGDLARAEPVMREALEMDRRLHPKEKFPDGHADLVYSLSGMGVLLQTRGQYGQAEPFYREALEMTRRLHPKDKYPDGHADVANSLLSLGFLFHAQGEYARAAPFLGEALEIWRRLYPRDKYPDGHPDLARELRVLGSLILDQDDYDQAESLLREALGMNRRLYPRGEFPNGHHELLTSLDRVGTVLQRRGEYARAEPFFREALNMAGRLYPPEKYPGGHYQLAAALNNLGLLLKNQGKYDEAEPLLRDAVNADRRLYKGDNPHTVTGLSNLGLALRERGKYAEAEPLLREALDMSRRLFPRDKFPGGHPTLAHSLHNLAGLLEDQGEYAKAEALCREALGIQRHLFPTETYPDGHSLLALSLHGLGFLLQMQGEHAKAEPLHSEALAMHRRLASRLAGTAAEAEALNYLASLPRSRDRLLSATRRRPADPATYDLIWDARAPLTRLLERRHRDLLASRDDQARDLGRQLVEARQGLAFILLNPARDPEEYRKEVQKRTEAKEDLERRLARRLKLAPPRTDPGQSTPQRLAALLPEGAAFVDLLRYGEYEQDPRVPGKKGETYAERYVAFVSCRGRPAARVELQEAAAIEAAWADWRKAITADRPDESAERRAAARLADLVWRPLRAAVPDDLRTLYLAPEGKLSQVPWGALPGREAGAVLLDECAVCLVPHGPSLLERLEAPAGPAHSGDTLVAYGGVDFAQPAAALAGGEGARAPLLADKKRLVWPELPGTAREQQQVVAVARKALRDKPIERTGRSASTGQLLADLPQARYAHLATHGFFADAAFRSALQVDPNLFDSGGRLDRRGGARSPLVLSGLVLAGANREGKDAAPDRGIVTGEGLIELPLEGLELAVLSACETGLGEDGGGEGAYGLQRAFHVAGCRGVMASLWKVDDGATQALMALFYRNLWERKLDPAEALRRAQLTLYRHPEAIAVAQKRGADFTESDLPKVEEKPAEKPKHSPAAHWAAFTFSGVRPASKGN